MGKTLSDQVVQILVDTGVKYVYGIPGDAIDLIVSAIHHRKDFNFYLTRHGEIPIRVSNENVYRRVGG